MKNLSSILLSLTVLMVIMSSCSKCKDTPVPSFTVSFNLNGASGTLANQTVSSGTAITLSASSASTFYYTGYTFVGWNTLANGSGTSYTAGSSYTVSGNVTLYAIWQLSPTYTITFNLNGGAGSLGNAVVIAGASTSLPASSVGTFYYTDYTFVGWNTLANGTGTSYNAGSSYTPTSNVTLYAIWKSIFTAVFTATDASLTALDKSISGNGVVKSLVLNVTTAGTAKLESIGSMTNGNPAIAYYWITSKDSSDINQATSTLNPVLAKTVITASQTINLSVGVNVICFKAAAFSGSITNGTQIGLKITGANSNTISNASYTANSGVANTTTIVRINLLLSNNVVVSSGQNTGKTFTDFKLTPYNNEAGSVYDGSMYPSLLSISFDTKDTRYFTTTTGYGNLDFNNASGSQGRSLILAQDDNGANNYMCLNSNASFSSESGIMNFTPSAPQRFLKSFLGNYAYCNTATNVYNSGASNFGPASTCWPIKSIRLASNPEIWIYNPSGTRIQ